MPSIDSQPPVHVDPRLGPTHHSWALLPPCRPGGKWENGLCPEQERHRRDVLRPVPEWRHGNPHDVQSKRQVVPKPPVPNLVAERRAVDGAQTPVPPQRRRDLPFGWARRTESRMVCVHLSAQVSAADQCGNRTRISTLLQDIRWSASRSSDILSGWDALENETPVKHPPSVLALVVSAPWRSQRSRTRRRSPLRQAKGSPRNDEALCASSRDRDVEVHSEGDDSLGIAPCAELGGARLASVRVLQNPDILGITDLLSPLTALGARPAMPPAAMARPSACESENGEHHCANVCALAACTGVLQEPGHHQKAQRSESEERAQQSQRHRYHAQHAHPAVPCLGSATRQSAPAA